MNRRLRVLEDQVTTLDQRLDTVTRSLTANNRPINFIARFDDIDAQLITVANNTDAASLRDPLNNINRQLTVAPGSLRDRLNNIDRQLITVANNTDAASLRDPLNNITRQLTVAPDSLRDRLNDIDRQLDTIVTNTDAANLGDRLNDIEVRLDNVTSNTNQENLGDPLNNINIQLNAVTNNLNINRGRIEEANGLLNRINGIVGISLTNHEGPISLHNIRMELRAG
jgi:tetrahydromethanopterin S-methyltransferase subunit G